MISSETVHQFKIKEIKISTLDTFETRTCDRAIKLEQEYDLKTQPLDRPH